MNNTWHLGTAPLPRFNTIVIVIVTIIVIVIEIVDIVVIFVNVQKVSTFIVCGTINSEGEDTGASIVRA